MATAQNIGPSTTTPPYVLPSIPGVSTTAILTVGNSAGGYRMVGIPDGIGLLRVAKADSSGFDIALGHELGKSVGILRSHGSRGAFVSRWTLDRKLRVEAGRDHLANASSLFLWNGGSWSPGATAFDRFCSGDLADQRAFSFRGLGTSNRIFLNGEETTPPSSAEQAARLLTMRLTNEFYPGAATLVQIAAHNPAFFSGNAGANPTFPRSPPNAAATTGGTATNTTALADWSRGPAGVFAPAGPA